MGKQVAVFFFIAVIAAYLSGCNEESSESAAGTASQIDCEPGTILLSFSPEATLQEASAMIADSRLTWKPNFTMLCCWFKVTQGSPEDYTSLLQEKQIFSIIVTNGSIPCQNEEPGFNYIYAKIANQYSTGCESGSPGYDDLKNELASLTDSVDGLDTGYTMESKWAEVFVPVGSEQEWITLLSRYQIVTWAGLNENCHPEDGEN